MTGLVFSAAQPVMVPSVLADDEGDGGQDGDDGGDEGFHGDEQKRGEEEKIEHKLPFGLQSTFIRGAKNNPLPVRGMARSAPPK